MIVINDELKDALLDMILDLDSHFPEDVFDDEYCKWFYETYIEPILRTQDTTV